MIINLCIKPLSINAAFQGRRFKTKECKQYCQDLSNLLPKNEIVSGYVEIDYIFYIKNWKMTDGDNLVKVLTDCIVQNGIIEDDRKILKYTIEKYPAIKEDSIYIEIRPSKRQITVQS